MIRATVRLLEAVSGWLDSRFPAKMTVSQVNAILTDLTLRIDRQAARIDKMEQDITRLKVHVGVRQIVGVEE